MKRKKSYHELYGFLPKEIVDRLTTAEKMLCIAEFAFREPTPAGRLIVTAVIMIMGDKFIKYLTDGAEEALKHNGKPFTEEDVKILVKEMMDHFSADPNSMLEVLDEYADANDVDLEKLIQDTISGQEVIREEKNEEESADSEYHLDANGRLRDSKGHFVKNVK